MTGIRGQLETSLKSAKIKLIHGTATFRSPSSVTVESNGKSEDLSFDKALITAGTEIYYPSALEPHKEHLLNSDTALELTASPESIVIVGGGAIGLEFACLLNAVGTKVTVIELKPAILPGEDPAVVSALARSLEARGIALKTGVSVKELKKGPEKWDVTLSNDEKLETHHVMTCVGRVPKPALLNIEKANIELDGKKLKLNEFLQTTNPHIYAAGDVATTRLAHAAAAQAEVAAANILGEKESFDDSLTPRCLYSWPEVASVGKWKYQLDEEKKPVKTTRAFFKGSAKALAANETEGFVQIVKDPESNKILGAQIIGAHATELIHIFSVALKAQMTTFDLAKVMFAHPTLAESIRDAARR